MKSDKLIWILEDDKGCRFVYEKVLDIRYNTRYFDTLSEFVGAFDGEQTPDLIVADITLKDGTFIEVLSGDQKAALANIPFMVVSSVSDIDALRFCFEEGARDYLVKPFDKVEFIIKVERLLKQASEISVNNDDLSLTKKEKEILKVFVAANGKPVSRNEIMDVVWKDSNIAAKTLDVHLSSLRRKIQKKGMELVSRGTSVWSLIN